MIFEVIKESASVETTGLMETGNCSSSPYSQTGHLTEERRKAMLWDKVPKIHKDVVCLVNFVV